jgi:hypothetical protein
LLLAIPFATQVSAPRLTGLIKQQTSLADLQDLLQRHSGMTNAIHVTAALQWLLAHPREQPQAPEQLAAVVQQLVQCVDVEQLSARTCASLAYYCSKLGYMQDLSLYKGLLQRIVEVKEDADPQGLSNMLYALGSQQQLRGLLDHDVLVTLLQQLQVTAACANAWDLSNAVWAAAKVGPTGSVQLQQVLAQLMSSLSSKLDATNPQDLSNTLYALALLPEAWPMDSALQLVKRLVQLLPQATPQEVANALWALGQYAERGWLVPVSKQWLAAATQLLHVLATKVTWTQSKVGEAGASVDPQALSNACLGMVKLQNGCASPGQPQTWQAPFGSAADVFVRVLPQSDPQGLANIVWSCGVVRHYPQQLLAALTEASSVPQVQQSDPQEVANLAWALAVLAPDLPPAALMASLLQRMQDLVAQQPAAPTSQALSNTAWAVAVLDQQRLARQLEPLAAAAFSEERWATSKVEALSQWHQVHLWLTDTQMLGPAGLGAFPGVSQNKLVQCQLAWEERLAGFVKASDVQKEVSKVGITVDATCQATD